MDAYSQPQPTYRFQLVALLHDMGKIQFLWGGADDGQRGTADGPQWVRIETYRYHYSSRFRCGMLTHLT